LSILDRQITTLLRVVYEMIYTAFLTNEGLLSAVNRRCLHCWCRLLSVLTVNNLNVYYLQ